MRPLWALWTAVIVLLGHAVTTYATPSAGRGPARRMLAQHAEAHADAPAGSGAIMQCLWSESIGCALNPSYVFAIDAPADSYERVLMEVTAMRYACLSHATEAECSDDVRGWCWWAEEEGGGCSLHYDDAE
ncbi:MAG: hypothetical protein J3K34DRAFT_394103 [Monoraphidium minutum]|nr:MAG: hypothetical protein J3K34DRAFT_394103 [Monoraphidium minutum]